MRYHDTQRNYFWRSLCLCGLILYSVSIGAQDAKVNINTADERQLDTGLVGVGPKKAIAIISHRKKHGPFRAPQHIIKVKGIGMKTYLKNKQRIVVDWVGQQRGAK